MISVNDEGIIAIEGERGRILAEFGGIAASLIHGNGYLMSELLEMLAIVGKTTKEQYDEMSKEVDE